MGLLGRYREWWKRLHGRGPRQATEEHVGQRLWRWVYVEHRQAGLKPARERTAYDAWHEQSEKSTGQRMVLKSCHRWRVSKTLAKPLPPLGHGEPEHTGYSCGRLRERGNFSRRATVVRRQLFCKRGHAVGPPP
jgi:hypothetical protein